MPFFFDAMLGLRMLPTPPRHVDRAAIATLPNAISLARLCAVPVTIYLVIEEAWLAAFGLFAAAGDIGRDRRVAGQAAGGHGALGRRWIRWPTRR